MPMTTDELLAVIDTVTEHLLKQNAKSVSPKGAGVTGQCAYRGLNGHKCAIGVLISDDAYTETINTLAVSHPFVADALERSGYNVSNDHKLLELLKELQTIHDSIDPFKWKSTLQERRKSWLYRFSKQ